VAYLLARPDLLRLQIADSFEKVGRYEQALKAYEAALEQNPDDLGLRARAVRALLALGRADDAIARAADGVGRGGAGQPALDLLRQGCEAAGRKGEAVEQLQRLRRKRPRDLGVVLALADVLRAEGRPGEAFELLRPFADASPPRAEAVRRMYDCAADTDDTGMAAARFLVGWSARHPDAVHLLAGRWDDLLAPTRRPRVRLAALKDLSPDKQTASPNWEAAKWFWVAQVARLRHRNDVARDALRRSVLSPALFAPGYRSASGVAGLDLSDSSGTGAGPDDAPYGADELAARAEAAGDKALAAELRGLGLLSRKQYAEARRQFDEAAKLGGASPDLHFARAVAGRGAGDDAAFESVLWKLLSDWPGYSNAYEALYAYHASRGADASAVKVLGAWLAADRDNVAARLFQARDFFRAGRGPAGERALEELVRDRGDVPAVLAAARSYYTQAGKLDAFTATLRERVGAKPASIAAAAQLADILADQHKPADAARVLDAARAAVADDADLLYEVAPLYGRVGQKEMTEQVLRDVLGVDPAHASAANDLGYTLADEGRELERAEALVRRAVEGDPANASFLDSLGWVLYKRGRFAESRDALAKAVETSSARGAEPDPVVLDHLGDALYRAGDGAAAAGRWKEAADRIATTPNAAAREDLKALRLQLERKTKQSQSGQPVTVAPVAVQAAASGRVGATN
jgi:tetratricopeptide (TPR) repeat protein